MDPVTGIVAGQAIQALTKAVSPSSDSETEGNSSDFSAQLRSLLTPDAANNVNEEELYAGLIEERIKATKGEEAAQAFASSFADKKAEMARGDGYVPVEDAANAALQSMVAAGTLTAEESNSISSQAFKAAQLDDNLDALYDGRGSGSDPTIATMGIEAALNKAKEALAALGVNMEGSDSDNSAGEETSSETDTETGSLLTPSSESDAAQTLTPAGNSFDGDGSGFLFKPESERGQLVILTPALLAHQIESVILKDDSGNVVEQGTSSGYANPDHQGEREHWRFSKAGSSYPANLTVEVTLASGEVRRYEIPDPSKRYD